MKVDTPFEIINFFHPVAPYPAQRTRSTANGHHYTPAKYKEYKEGLAMAMRVEANKANWFLPDRADQVAWRKAMRNCYAFNVVFMCDAARYDIDNLLKAVMDAGQEAGLYCNDKQVRTVCASMGIAGVNAPGTHICLLMVGQSALKKAEKKT